MPKNYSFCFAATKKEFAISETGCGAAKKSTSITLGETPEPSGLGTLEVDKLNPKSLRECSGFLPNTTSYEDLYKYEKFCEIMSRFATKKVSFEFYTKSTEAVIYYFSKVMRHQLHPDDLPQEPPYPSLPVPFRVMFDGHPEDGDLARCIQPPQKPHSVYCHYIFRVENDLIPSPAAISVIYNGNVYSVPDFDHDGGYSMSSLEIAKQLQALFSSAKTLPSTTVLSVTNQ